MSTSLGEAVLDLSADDAKLKADVAKAGKGAESALAGIGKKMTGVGKTMTAAVTLPILGIGAATIMMASDMEESRSKVRVVFGDSAAAVEEFAQSAATNLGMSESAALAAAGTYGNLFTSMGMGKEASADMSTGLITLAGDLASFNNQDPTEVLEKLRAGLTGETEPLKSLGVNMNAAAVTAKAMEMGLAKLTPNMAAVKSATSSVSEAQSLFAQQLKDTEKSIGGQHENLAPVIKAYEELELATKNAGVGSYEYDDALAALTKTYWDNYDALDGMLPAMGYLTAENDKLQVAYQGTAEELDANAKAQATYALIMEQTTNAQGDFARTSDGLANSMRITKAQIADAGANIGQMLLPFALQAVEVIRNLVTWFSNLSPGVMTTILVVAGLAAAIGPLLMIIGTLITSFTAIMPVITTVGTAIGGMMLPIAAIIAVIAILALAWKNNWGGIQEKTKAAIEFVKGVIQAGLAAIKAWWDQHGAAIIAAATKAWEMIKKVLQAGVEFIMAVVSAGLAGIKAFWDQHGTAILAAASSAWEAIKGVIESITKIISSIFAAFKSAFEGDWYGFGENLRKAWDDAWELIKKILSGAWEAIKGIIDKLVTNVVDTFKNTDWAAVGKAVLEGIAKGITGGLKIIVDAAKAAARAAFEAAKGLLGINSPSKLFMDIGGNMMAGMALGIENSAMLPALATQDAASMAVRSTNNYYTLQASYGYQSEATLIDQVKMLSLLGGA
jgi:phage-related protein